MAYKKRRSGKGKKSKFSAAERKAYWMGVGAGELARENPTEKYDIPIYKVKDLGSAAVASYHKGFGTKYRAFQ